jgi:hypothetical protein
MEKNFFCSYAQEKGDLLSNFLWAKSIRDFAGTLSNCPIHIYIPNGLLHEIQNSVNKFNELDVSFRGYSAAPCDFEYFFKPLAAYAAEQDIKNGTVLWFDRSMLVLNSCADLLLHENEKFAYRATHFQNIGSSYDMPPNQLWETMYEIAGIHESALFPTYTVVDRKRVRAYFYACQFSFRAECELMKEWFELFTKIREEQRMQPFLKDETIRIYLHQATLSLSVLKKCTINMLKPLPLYYGYPTHIYTEIQKLYQVGNMSELNTAYYSPDFQGKDIPDMPVTNLLMDWLLKTKKEFNVTI